MQNWQDVLDFWFGLDYDPFADAQEFRKEWFVKDADFDSRIEERFGGVLERAVCGDYDDWPQTPRQRLALVVVLDQFSRNIFRGSPRSWTQDLLAQKLTLEGIAEGCDRDLGVVERAFFYLPLEHAEDLQLQKLSVEKFEEIRDIAPDVIGGEGGFYDYAVQHLEIIERFGRFPHRNAVIGRPSTPEEEEFLKQPGSSF